MFNMLSWKGKDNVKKDLIPDLGLESMLLDSIKETRKISNRIITKLDSEIQAREVLLDKVFNTIEGAIVLKDSNGRIKVLNKDAKYLYGIVDSEYKDKTFGELQNLYKNYNTTLFHFNCYISKVLETNQPEIFEQIISDVEGNQFLAKITITPITEEGYPSYVMLHIVNISKDKDNIRQISALVNALNKASDAIAVLDAEFNVIYVNTTYLQLVNKSTSEVVNKPIDILSDYFLSDLATRLDSEALTFTTSKNKVTVTPIFNGKPHPINYIVVVRSQKE
jgi:PAS domain S-box-containing protein